MMLHLEKLFYSVPQRMSVCGFCLSYTLPWDLGLFCCIPTFVFLNIVCGGNFHLSRQQMWMRTKFSNRCRIRRWPNRLPFYSSNNSGHWASVGYTWYGFTNIIRHQLFVRQYRQLTVDWRRAPTIFWIDLSEHYIKRVWIKAERAFDPTAFVKSS